MTEFKRLIDACEFGSFSDVVDLLDSGADTVHRIFHPWC